MANLFRDIVAFVVAVLRHWVVLMGGVIMTIVTLVERGRGNEISPKVYWPIIVGFIAIAVFLAWRAERQRWERLSEKVLVLSPAELASVYKGRTDVQGEALASIYKGKWITVQGTLGNVTVGNYGLPFIRYALLTFSSGYPMVMMFFKGSWASRLSMLPTNEPITVSGRIAEVQRTTVTLRNCELLYLPSGSGATEEANQTASSQNVGSIPNSKTD